MATSNDPLGQAQDVKQCQLCPGKDKKSAAETCCNSCQVNLCKVCVGNHVISDPDMKHDFVNCEFKNHEIMHHQCSLHEEEKCEMFCQLCNSLICLKCLTSGAHENHNVQSISEIYKSRRDVITKDNGELETEIKPVYEAVLSEIETMTSNVLQQHEDRHKSITNLREQFHKLVENVIRRYLNVSKEKYSQDNDNLLTLKGEFQRLQSLIQSAIDDNKSILSSVDSSKLIHYKSRNEDFKHIPPRFELTVPQFIPAEITEEVLCKMTGIIPETMKINIQGKVIRVAQPLAHSRKISRNFINEPQIISTVTLNPDDGLTYRIECIPNTNEFYVTCKSETIYHMNTEGDILETIYSEYRDLAVTREGDLVCNDTKNKCINVIKRNGAQCLIALKIWIPLAICCTSKGDLLVAMKHGHTLESPEPCKVVRYRDSTVIQEIQCINGDESIYHSPMFIAENKNLDIVVSDSIPGQVVVVDNMGKLKFDYKGHQQSIKHEQFLPFGIATDSMCHIFIADHGKHVIHVIDRNGYFLLYISNCELHEPYDLSLDSDENLFVSELRSGKVNQIKLFE
ncbi:uncharacterized protein LOC134254879 [Saccostrea cucullata]|uniref:uncharacterized protein LOC134254879 n=1 Tax=Saccostrea cuccullata TaxID=36930 RepID=UPI002ED0689B